MPCSISCKLLMLIGAGIRVCVHTNILPRICIFSASTKACGMNYLVPTCGYAILREDKVIDFYSVWH
jgi:hypothetical protein